MHLSDVIHDMDKTLMLTNSPGWDEDEVRDHRNLNFEKGYLWEATLKAGFGEMMAIRPDEVVVDGIAMNPDGVRHDWPDTAVLLEEYKCTACSPRPPSDNWKWMMQVKGYCKALGALKCIFRIFYPGAVMTHPESAYGVFLLTFTQGELDENWEAVLNHAKVMRGRDDVHN